MTKDDLYLKIDEMKTYKMHLLIKTLFLLMWNIEKKVLQTFEIAESMKN